MLKFLFSFEWFFVLWLFSYQYKNAFDIFCSPDITVLLTFVLIPWAFVISWKNKASLQWRNPAVLAFLGMGVWFIVSAFWSPSPAYKIQKTLCYALYTIPGFLMGYGVIGQNPERLKRLMGAFLVFGTLVLAETYRVFFANGLSAISDILGTNYLVTGQTLGVAVLALLSWGYFRWRVSSSADQPLTSWGRPNIWVGAAFFGSLFFYALVNLGGRGPVIATTLALAVFYGTRCWLESSLKPTVYFAIFAIFCLVTYFGLNGAFDHTGSHFHQRMASLLAGQADQAVSERLTYYQSAISVFLKHPLAGCGFGGWPITSGFGEADLHLHPHNIFLEVSSETGLVGLALFAAFLYFSVRRLGLAFLFSAPERASLVLLTVFAFANAQKTGDLHDNLLLFAMLSLCAGISTGRSTGDPARVHHV